MLTITVSSGWPAIVPTVVATVEEIIYAVTSLNVTLGDLMTSYSFTSFIIYLMA